MPTFNDLLARQIGNEFAASQQYIAVAVWFHGQDLPQLASGHSHGKAVGHELSCSFASRGR